MKCHYCDQRAVIMPPRCAAHFVEHFEERVCSTITEFALLSKEKLVGVACSGGKDSLTLLHILQQQGYRVHALLIDEGIAGYRDKTCELFLAFCTERKIPHTVVSFKEEVGDTLDGILQRKKLHPCTICGTFRRSLLNKHAKRLGFDVIATGHNADDEAQAVLMNLTRANTALFPRGGPRTTSSAEGFIPRVKPLYFCTEKEILTYALLQKFASEFNECPNVAQAYRATIRDQLNAYEAAHPGTKVKLLQHYLKLKEMLVTSPSVTIPCHKCGEPSQDGACKACRFITLVSEPHTI